MLAKYVIAMICVLFGVVGGVPMMGGGKKSPKNNEKPSSSAPQPENYEIKDKVMLVIHDGAGNFALQTHNDPEKPNKRFHFTRGKVESGETHEAAAKRENSEEVGHPGTLQKHIPVYESAEFVYNKKGKLVGHNNLQTYFIKADRNTAITHHKDQDNRIIKWVPSSEVLNHLQDESMGEERPEMIDIWNNHAKNYLKEAKRNG